MAYVASYIFTDQFISNNYQKYSWNCKNQINNENRTTKTPFIYHVSFLFVSIYVPLPLYKYCQLFHYFFFFSSLFNHKLRKMFFEQRLLLCELYTHTSKQMQFEISSTKIACRTFQSLTQQDNKIKFINKHK